MNFSTPYNLGMGLAAAVLLGYALCVFLLQRQLSRKLAWVFGPGIGLGVCSFLYVVFRRPIFAVESILLIISVVFLYRRFRNRELLLKLRRPHILSLLFCVVLVLVLGTLLAKIERIPHGDWDGWVIWNTHARMLYRTPDWKDLTRYTLHGDYPELTPSLAARFWRYVGHEVPSAGALAGLTLGLSGIVVLIAALSHLRDKRLAMVMGFALLGTPGYLNQIASQYADIPLSFYVLATLAIICLHAGSGQKEKSTLVLAGFAAGCAGWTKNEGLLFIAAVCAAMLAPVVLRRARISSGFVPFVAGLLVPLAVIVAFKLTVPVRNDLVVNQSYSLAIQHIMDASRYRIILSHAIRGFWTFGAWTITPFVALLAFVATRGVDRSSLKNDGYWVAFLTLGLILAGYFMVYLNTPLPLQIHLESSFERLAIHVWPSFLLLLGICVKSESAAQPQPLALLDIESTSKHHPVNLQGGSYASPSSCRDTGDDSRVGRPGVWPGPIRHENIR